MNDKIIMFDDTEIEKLKIHICKLLFKISNVDIDNIIIYGKVSFCKNDFKAFISPKDDEKVKQLCVMVLKMSGYARIYDSVIIPFLIEVYKLLGKHNK